MRSSANGTVLPRSGRRASTSQKPPGISVEKCTRIAVPSGSAPSIAAGIVADVFTTTTSPRCSVLGRSANVACTTSSIPSETSRRTSDRSRPRTSGGSDASWAASSGATSADCSMTAVMTPAPAPGSARRPGRSRSGRPAPARSSPGSGRSEMSSPGNASWCISVRMSPGSTTSTRRSASSTASTADSCSNAALEDPYPPHAGYASTAASDVTFRIVPCDWRSVGTSSWVRANGATTLTS